MTERVPQSEGGPIRVLHVDDDADFLKTSKAILEMQGTFQVETASCVEEAWEKMKKEEYDAVVSDYQMPGKDGLQFLKELRQKGNRIPFVIFTGKGREEVVIKALNLGADHYENKNGDPEIVYSELSHEIINAVRTRRAEQELRIQREDLQIVLDSMPEKIWYKDRNNRLVRVNKAFAEYMGVSKENLEGKPLCDFFPPDIAQKCWEEDKEVFTTGQPKTDILDRHESAQGVRWFSTGKVPCREKDGNIIGTINFSVDITERKQAEEKIKQTYEEWKRTFDAISDFAFIVDRDYRLVRVNKAVCDALRKEPKELIGRRCFEVLHGTDKPWPNCPHTKTLATGKAITEEINDPHLGLPLLVTNSPIFDNKGELTEAIHLAKDITERKKTEESLKKEQQELNRIIDSSPIIIFYKDKEGKIIRVNEAFAKALKIPKEKFLGKTVFDIYSAKIAQGMTNDDSEVLRSGRPKLGIIEQYESANGLRCVQTDKIPILDRNDIPVGLVGFAQDITERKKAEGELKRYSEYLANIFAASPDAITVSDLNGNVIQCNKATLDMLGFSSKEELIGQNGFSFIAKRDHQKAAEYLKKTFEQGSVKNAQYTFLTKDGHEIQAELSASVIRDALGNPTEVVSVTKDITERKRMEEKLKEYSEHLEEKVEERTNQLKKTQEQLLKAEKLAAIGEAANMLGHDLRNPLQAIENATYYLGDELTNLSASIPISQKTMDMIQVIYDSVNYADGIVRGLHDFSATKKTLLKRIDINMLVKETLSQAKAPGNVEINTELSQLPEIMVDIDQMKRVFLNFITNGTQAMENGGTLTVSTKKTGDFVEVNFKDTGVGITKENMEKLFSPFFTTKAKGMGMGLPICKKFVESHGGSIEVESNVGKGSTFTVKLPIAQENGGENQ